MTLLTFIGKGTPDESKSGNYRKTTYEFPEGQIFTTSVFAEALLGSRQDIDAVIVLGTYTSSWTSLIIEHASALGVDDFVQELMAKEDKGIDDSYLSKINEILTQVWKRSTRCFAHTKDLGPDSQEEIFNFYYQVARTIESDGLIVDITHGFRVLPIILWSSLPKTHVKEVLYGEYDNETKKSPVRKVSLPLLDKNYRALELFNSSFKGELLAECLPQNLGDLNKWLHRFSLLIEANYFLQIEENVRNLKNVLEKLSETELPPWIKDLVEYLNREVYKKLAKKSLLSEKMLALSEILHGKSLDSKAVLCVWLAVEARGFELLGQADKIGNYDYYQEHVKKKILDLRQHHPMRQQLSKLEGLRNQIAHGGALNLKTEEYPSAENLKSQFSSYSKAVKSFLDDNPLTTK